jgi:hypothetical protein
MSRVWTLTLFFTHDLFLSLTGIVPLAAGLAFGLIAFEYGMDQPQFATVGGVGIGLICLLTTLLLAGRANRASSYLLIARLRHRTELLATLILSSLAITGVLGFLIAAGNLLAGRLALEFPSVLWLLPTWLALWLAMAALGLILSTLDSRDGSNLVGYLLVAGLLLINDQRVLLEARGLDWLARAAAIAFWPVGTLLSKVSAGVHDRSYFAALALTSAIALLLFLLASQLFADKDLLWPE